MKTNEKASLQVLKITIVTLILIFTCNIAVRAMSSKLNSVKIVLSNNYEMNVLTTKTKVSEILEENHIVLLPDESVFPNQDTELNSNGTITVSKVGSETSGAIEIADEESTISKEQILGNYSAVVEKIEVKEEEIPYETITKNSKTASDDRSNKVIKQGENGLKEVTYKVKYQNDVEISRIVIKEEIKKKAVNKIVQVNDTTSRSGETTERESKKETKKASTSVASKASSSNSLAAKVEGMTPIVKTLNTSAYTASTCGKKAGSKGYGVTSSGKKASSWYTVAAGKNYPVGTVIYVPALKNKPNGGWFVVQDRGGAISNNRLDIYMSTYNECIQFGRKNLECYIYVK